jgi:hypothetical protein
MSLDTTDDLHAAEDFAGLAVETLRQIIDPTADAWRLNVARETARALLAQWESYCRPTCNPNDDGAHDEVCEEGDTCGCPCRDREVR